MIPAVAYPQFPYAPAWQKAGRPRTSDVVAAARRQQAGQPVPRPLAVALYCADMWAHWDGLCGATLAQQAVALDARQQATRILVVPDLGLLT